MADLVSFLMPVYRPRADWLREAVGTALSEDDVPIELLVIDDGSPDPVTELLSSFDDPRLRVIRIEHGGVSHARNVGIREARGDYIRYLDGDDLVEPGSTARLLSMIGGRDDVIAYGATLFCEEDMSPMFKMTSDVEGDGVTAALLARFTMRFPALLFPRRVVDAAGEWNPELVASADLDWSLRALEHATLTGTHEVTYRYRRHPTGLTSNLEQSERGARYVVESYFRRHPELRGTRLERKARARTLAHTGRVYMTHGRLGKGFSRLTRAMLLDPHAIWIEIAQGRQALIPRLRQRLHRRGARRA